MSYISNNSFEKRKSECLRIMSKYPDRIPVIVEPNGKNDIEIDNKKYLVPNDFNVGQFIYVLRKRIKLSADKSLFLFINNDMIPNVCFLMSEMYYNYSNDDGFLYVKYRTEMAAFG